MCGFTLKKHLNIFIPTVMTLFFSLWLIPINAEISQEVNSEGVEQDIQVIEVSQDSTISEEKKEEFEDDILQIESAQYESENEAPVDGYKIIKSEEPDDLKEPSDYRNLLSRCVPSCYEPVRSGKVIKETVCSYKSYRIAQKPAKGAGWQKPEIIENMEPDPVLDESCEVPVSGFKWKKLVRQMETIFELKKEEKIIIPQEAKWDYVRNDNSRLEHRAIEVRVYTKKNKEIE